jgi:intracellular sulfur oxidation DsrE/DsrF family protein
MRWMAVTILAMLLASPLQARAEQLETELAEPLPGFDQPRRILLQISTGDERKINDVLWNAINLQKFYGLDNVEILVVVFGPGMVALYRADSPVRERIESQLKYGIGFVGCGNTMEATHRTAEDLIEGVDYVESGIAEIVERQLAGWTYVHP